MQTKRTFKISSNFEASEKWTLIIFRKWFMPNHRGNSEKLIWCQCQWYLYRNLLSSPFINFFHLLTSTNFNVPLEYWPNMLASKTMWTWMHSVYREGFKWVRIPDIEKCIHPLQTDIFSVTWNLQIVAEKIWWTHRNSPNSVFLKYTFFICCSTLTSYKF